MTQSWLVKPGAVALEQLVTQLDRLTSQRRGAATESVVKCCSLALSPWDGCYTWCINHGGGYWIEYWWCCYGGYRYQCQECTNGADCESGNFLCSNIAGSWLC
jgi:hypothetical protein